MARDRERFSGRTMLAAVGAAALLWQLARPWRRERLAGKVALVTGGSRGLGFLIARELGRRGMRVVVCARDGDELDRASRMLEGAGVENLALRCDVSDGDDVRRLVSETTERLGGVDVLVNNAGTIHVGPAETMALEDYRQALQTTFWGAVHASEAVLPQMRDRGSGTIVDITSIGAAVAVPHLGPYSAAKFAHRGYSEALNAEAAKYGVRVVTVLPWLMRTGSAGKALVKGQRSREASLFAVAGSAPLLTWSAERAARRVVRAIERRERFVVLGAQARALRLLHDLFPGPTLALLAALNRLLPGARGAQPAERAQPGERFRRGLGRSLLTALGDSAARRLNQVAR